MALGAVILALVTTSTASAQTERELRRARAAFAAGVEHADAGRWEQAAERFRAAIAVRAAPPVSYNLAAALTELGKTKEPWALVQAVLADATTSPELLTNARDLAARLGPRRAFVRVVLAGTAPSELAVRVGDAALEGALTEPIEVEPGPIVVEATAAERSVARAEVNATAGATVEARLVVGPTPAETAAASATEAAGDDGTAPASEPTAASTAGGEGGPRWPVFAAIGGGVVLVAVFIGVAAASSGTADPVGGDFSPGVLTWQ